MSRQISQCLAFVAALFACGTNAFAQTARATEPSQTAPPPQSAPGDTSATSDLKLVVIVTRHGVRSPTSDTELLPYMAYPMPKWEVPPGDLTPNGAKLMTIFGAAYRTQYAPEGIFPETGCPPPESMYVWADMDERTRATAAALIAGLAPKCNFVANNDGQDIDPMFHSVPYLGVADPVKSRASLAGFAEDPTALVRAHGLEFKKLDDILGCATSTCTRISSVPMKLTPSKSGLAGFEGAVDLASTAVEDFILAYADGKPLADIGRGKVDASTLLELSQLHTLKFAINTEPPYSARTLASNLLSHVAATLDQGSTGVLNDKTRAPVASKFVAFVGHDTNLEALAGMLQLHWLVPGYQVNDTPPGGALVFELHQSSGADHATFVRTFFETQSLDEMRTLSTAPPLRVAVYIPGCPDFDCPIATFDSVVNAAIDPKFVGQW